MQFVEGQAKGPDDETHQAQDQRRPFRAEEGGQRASAAVVVPRQRLLGREAEELRIMAGHPVADRVQRLAGKEEVLHQDDQRSSSGQLGTAVFLGKVKFEELFELHAFEEMIDDRQRADRPGLQGVVAAFSQVAATAAGGTSL